MAGEPSPAPAAYCAPGRKTVAELVLTLRGKRYSGVTEHPYLADWDGIMVVSQSLLDPLESAPLPMMTPAFWGLFDTT